MRATGSACRYPAGMTVAVHFATRKRNARPTGRDRAMVAVLASTNNGTHDHGLPAHQIPSTRAAAQTAGTSMLTTTTTHDRTNPTQALVTHDTTCPMIPPPTFSAVSTVHRTKPDRRRIGPEVGLAPPIRGSRPIPHHPRTT